jgi:hypothetical protein
MVHLGSQEYMMNYFVFDIFVNNQIWLKRIVDDCYFNYITKLKINHGWWAVYATNKLANQCYNL